MISIQLSAELLTVAMFSVVATMFSIVELQKFLKVIGCTKSALFPNSEIHFENG